MLIFAQRQGMGRTPLPV